MSGTHEALTTIFRTEAGLVIAALTKMCGDIGLAEDAFQDAIAAALARWPTGGVPRNPAAWLTTTARRRVIDRLRRASTRRNQQGALEVLTRLEVPGQHDLGDHHVIPDSRLELMFTCCHPALSPEGQVALTLRTLGGLETPQIARAFLVPETTLAQRLVRAKWKIKDAGIPFRIPAATELPERLATVLMVLYLVFNEGHGAALDDDPERRALAGEAIRLCRVLDALLAVEPEILGLLALMLLLHSRRDARLDDDGMLVTLDKQDWTRWDHGMIREGLSLVRRVAALRRPGPYQPEAAIAAVHAESPSPNKVDWVAIVALYGALMTMRPTPVVALNRAVAVAMAEDAQAGLVLIDQPSIAEPLESYQPYHVARAELLRRAGQIADARGAYRRAIELTVNAAERLFLERQLAQLAR